MKSFIIGKRLLPCIFKRRTATEISILSLGGIVLSKLIKIGGQKFDESIKNAIRKEYSLIVGNKTAESVKISLKELEPPQPVS